MKRFIFILFLGLIFRILLVPIARHGDVNNNTSWGQSLLSRGPRDFYDGRMWLFSAPNQPPLYLYTFGITSFFQNGTTTLINSLNKQLAVFPSQLVWINEQWGELYWAKLPGIIADIGIAVVIYKFFVTKKKTGLILSTLWLINPISWYNSAIWGGTDSIVNLLGLLSIYFLVNKKKLHLATIFFTLSLLFKGSIALLFPILLLIAIKQKHKSYEYVLSAVLSLLTVVIVALPFHTHLDSLIYLYRLYTERFFPGEIGSLTANAFNFWWIVDSGVTLDSKIYFGIAARLWGILFMSCGYLFLLYKVYKAKNNKSIFLSLSLIPLLTFLFMTRIHERYMYPFFPLATIALGEFSSLLVPLTILSVTNLLNMYHLFWAPGIPTLEYWYLNPTFMIVLSLVNLFTFGYIMVRYQKSL